MSNSLPGTAALATTQRYIEGDSDDQAEGGGADLGRHSQTGTVDCTFHVRMKGGVDATYQHRRYSPSRLPSGPLPAHGGVSLARELAEGLW